MPAPVIPTPPAAAAAPPDPSRLFRDDHAARPVHAPQPDEPDPPRLLRDDDAPRPVHAPQPDEPDPPAPRLLDAKALPRHVDRLFRAAVALCGDPVDAEDLVQEVCLRALAKPRLIRGADDLPYLMQMLRNVFYNQCRSQAGRRTTPVEPETLAVVPAGRRHDPELGLLVREVHEAIAALPPHYRDVVVAVDVAGLAYGDAAAVLGIPVGTVMSRLHRARVGVARAVGEQAAA